MFLIRALEVAAFRRIDGNEIDHCVTARHKLGQTFNLFERVVDASQKRPLNLRRVLGLLGVVQGSLQQVLGSQRGSIFQKFLSLFEICRVKRQSQGGFHRPGWQRIKKSLVTHGGYNDLLVRQTGHIAHERHSLLDGSQIVRRFSHSHQNHFLDIGLDARGCHVLSRDFGAGKLTFQPSFAGHAKGASDGAANLRGDAKRLTRQKNRFHARAVGKHHQQFAAFSLLALFDIKPCQ